MKQFVAIFSVLLLSPLFPALGVANDWSAFSTIEKEPDGKSYKETVFLVNGSSQPVTLKFPDFQFPDHGGLPAEDFYSKGNLTLAPHDAVQFVHVIPIGRKDGFATVVGIQDVNEQIPVKQYRVTESFGAK